MKNSKTVVGAVLTTLLCVPVSRATTAIENDKNIDGDDMQNHGKTIPETLPEATFLVTKSGFGRFLIPLEP